MIVDRNKVLMGLAGGILVVAVAVYYVRSRGDTEQISEEASQHMTTVSCSDCGASWEMTFEDYQEASQKAAASGRSGLKCDKCGKETAWGESSFSKAQLPPVPPEMAAAAEGNPATPISDEPEEDDGQIRPEKLKPTANPMFDPNAPPADQGGGG